MPRHRLEQLALRRFCVNGACFPRFMHFIRDSHLILAFGCHAMMLDFIEAKRSFPDHLCRSPTVILDTPNVMSFHFAFFWRLLVIHPVQRIRRALFPPPRSSSADIFRSVVIHLIDIIANARQKFRSAIIEMLPMWVIQGVMFHTLFVLQFCCWNTRRHDVQIWSRRLHLTISTYLLRCAFTRAGIGKRTRERMKWNNFEIFLCASKPVSEPYWIHTATMKELYVRRIRWYAFILDELARQKSWLNEWLSVSSTSPFWWRYTQLLNRIAYSTNEFFQFRFFSLFLSIIVGVTSFIL